MDHQAPLTSLTRQSRLDNLEALVLSGLISLLGDSLLVGPLIKAQRSVLFIFNTPASVLAR